MGSNPGFLLRYFILSFKKLVDKAKNGRHFGKNFAHWVIKSKTDTFLKLGCIVPKKKGEIQGRQTNLRTSKELFSVTYETHSSRVFFKVHD